MPDSKPDAQELFDALCEPFPIDYIEWRIGATRDPYDSEIRDGKAKKGDRLGKPLCYVNARAVMDRLDTICGPDGWQCNYSAAPGNAIICNLGILIAGDWKVRPASPNPIAKGECVVRRYVR